MSYFKDVFIPSRTRVLHTVFSKHPWILKLKNLVLGETIRFGISFKTENDCIKYTLEEGPDGSISVFHGVNDLDFKVFKISLDPVFHVDEDFIREWVENEEKMMKHPLPYFFYYVLRTLPKLRLN